MKESAVRPLCPAYVLYQVQHIVLGTTQRLLEECCFYFATEWLPKILQEYTWGCPEAGELNKWTRILKKYCNKLPQHAFDNGDRLPLNHLFSSVDKLRHSAVHRLPLKATELIEMVMTGARFASVLRDQYRAAQLTQLCQELEDKIRTFEADQALLEKRLAKELREIFKSRTQPIGLEESVVREAEPDSLVEHERISNQSDIDEFGWDEADNEALYLF
jgi:hypothetical protein